jgi:hypothetical protein
MLIPLQVQNLLSRVLYRICLEDLEYGRRDPSRLTRGTLYPQKLALTSPTSGGSSVGIVRSRTQTMEFSFFSEDQNWFKILAVPVFRFD